MTGRDVPLPACNFQVEVTLVGPRGGRGRRRELACSEVVFPSLRLDGGRQPMVDGGREDRHESANLVLRRGHTGAPELYEWWRAERDGERFRLREVTVAVLGERHRPVTGWHFTGCRVVSLDYSPLDALDSRVFTESLEISFAEVRQYAVDR